MRDWADAIAWHDRLNRYAAGGVPGLRKAVAAAHIQGLFPGYAKAYLLIRTPRGPFIGLVVGCAESTGLAAPGALDHRATLADALDPGDLAARLAGQEAAVAVGHKYQVRAFLERHRREPGTLEHPHAGTLVFFPLRFPTLLRDLGLDPSHPPHGPRRDWLTVAELAGGAGLKPTRPLFDAFMARETDRARAAMTPAAGLADPDAAHALRLATRYPQDAYDAYARRSPHREARLQAAAAYPLFARAIAQVPAVRRAVDQRRPLVPALARAYMVSEAAVRCLQSFDHKTFPDHIDYMLLFLDDIDGTQCPGRKHAPEQPPEHSQWACFARLAHELNGLAAFIGGRGGRRAALKALLAGFDGDWCRLFHAVGGHADPRPVPAAGVPAASGADDRFNARRWALEEERVAAAVSWDNFRYALVLPWGGEGVRDAARAFAHSVVLPLAAARSGAWAVTVDKAVLKRAEAVAVRFCLQDRTLEQVVRFSRRFHRAVGALFPSGALDRLKGASLAWSKPSPPVETPAGLKAVPLGSAQDLVREGEALANCLPFYTVRCAVEGRRVVALRRDGASVAALEVTPEGPAWRLHQIEGPGNGSAPPEAEAAARWYVDWLNKQGDSAELPPDDNAGEADVLRTLCGYDWHDPRAVEAMWALWARRRTTDDGERLPAVLPKGALRRGLAGLETTHGFADLVVTLAADA